MTHADGRGSSGRLSPRQGLCHSPEEQQGRSRTGPAWREAAAPSRGPGLSSPARTAGDNGAASRYAGGLLPVLPASCTRGRNLQQARSILLDFRPSAQVLFAWGWRQWQQEGLFKLAGVLKSAQCAGRAFQ